MKTVSEMYKTLLEIEEQSEKLSERINKFSMDMYDAVLEEEKKVTLTPEVGTVVRALTSNSCRSRVQKGCYYRIREVNGRHSYRLLDVAGWVSRSDFEVAHVMEG